jgi:hypothetical protein
MPGMILFHLAYNAMLDAWRLMWGDSGAPY